MLDLTERDQVQAAGLAEWFTRRDTRTCVLASWWQDTRFLSYSNHLSPLSNVRNPQSSHSRFDSILKCCFGWLLVVGCFAFALRCFAFAFAQ